ncbi:MAG TPA: hypothetical protein VMU30_04370 [Bacteroidota bacterium]|nr:hypothetical protein [Bacteroidota bacterium]
MPTWLERLVVVLVVVFVLGFLFGLASHDTVFRQDPGHAVWKSSALSK